MSSIASRTAARFLADAVSLAFGMASGIITARFLGPEGKGVLASLVFLSTSFSQLSCLGLQEATIVMIGQKRATRQGALSATIAAVFATSFIGLLAFWIACTLQFGPSLYDLRMAVAVAALGIVVSNYSSVFSGFLISQDQIVASSGIMVVTSGLIAVTSWLFIRQFPLSVLGGALSSVVGSLAGVAIAVFLIRSLGFSLRPRWDTAYVKGAVRFGIGIQVSYVLTIMTSRLDLLLVYHLVGRSEAGQYSVALTIGNLATMVPAALSLVTFPILARLDDAEARELVGRTSRYAVLASLVFGLAMAALCPIIIPLAFGASYSPAVLPAIVLVAGGVPFSSQWLLARAAAARGYPMLISISYSVSLVVMVVLDLLLIPRSGILGAAIISSVAPVFGLAVCLFWYRRHSAAPILPSDLLPTLQDLAELTLRGRRLALRLVPSSRT